MEKAHKKLRVYNEAIKLAKIVYEETAKLPSEERFGLVAQMRRCSVSILSNIAEGAARQGIKEVIQFFTIARGSISELDAQIDLCLELSFFELYSVSRIRSTIEAVDSVLSGLIRYRKKSLFVSSTIFFCLLIAVLVFPFPVSRFPSTCLYAANYDTQIKEYKGKIKKSKKELVGVQSKISEKENNIKTIKRREASMEDQVENIVRKIEITKSELCRTKISINHKQKSIDALKVRLEIAESEMIRWKNILSKELRFVYKHFYGDGHIPCILISSNSSADIIKRHKFLQLLARQKVFIYIQTLKNVQQYEVTKTNLETEITMLKELEKKKKTSEQLCLKQKKEKNKILTNIVKKRGFYEQEVESLRDSETMLSELIKLLEKKAQESAMQKEEDRISRLKMSKKRGLVSWPLEGEPTELKNNLTVTFGKQKHPELDTWVINNGIRIKSSLGQNVLAADKGKVVFADDFKSYGKTVVVDHSGGFYTVYGNLDKISVKEGDVVIRGGILGTVGISVYSQDASLYFEFRKDGVPQDPVAWLK